MLLFIYLFFNSYLILEVLVKKGGICSCEARSSSASGRAFGNVNLFPLEVGNCKLWPSALSSSNRDGDLFSADMACCPTIPYFSLQQISHCSKQ